MKESTLTIAQSATTSDALKLDGRSILKIEFPTMTGASVTITEADAGGTYRTVGDENGALTISNPSGRIVHLNPSKTIGLGSIKLVSASTEDSARSILVHHAAYLP